jgi:hypothetical protein
MLTGKWIPRRVFEDCLILQLKTQRSFVTPVTVTTRSGPSLLLFISQNVTALSVPKGAAVSHDVQPLFPLFFFTVPFGKAC